MVFEAVAIIFPLVGLICLGVAVIRARVFPRTSRRAQSPSHVYTQILVSAIPRIDSSTFPGARLKALPFLGNLRLRAQAVSSSSGVRALCPNALLIRRWWRSRPAIAPRACWLTVTAQADPDPRGAQRARDAVPVESGHTL